MFSRKISESVHSGFRPTQWGGDPEKIPTVKMKVDQSNSSVSLDFSKVYFITINSSPLDRRLTCNPMSS